MVTAFLLSIYAGIKNKNPFVADVILDSTEQRKYDYNLNNTLGTITEATDESLM